MEEGSLRIDANVSVRAPGSTEFGTRAEIKNLNSLRSLLRAIDYEAERQWALTQAGEKVVQETRHWDEEQGRTISGRSKEEAHDYRYFPEPDLVPVEPTQEMRDRVRASMPELPAAQRARYVEQWGIGAEDARVLVDVPGSGRVRGARGRGVWTAAAAVRPRTSSTGCARKCWRT